MQGAEAVEFKRGQGALEGIVGRVEEARRGTNVRAVTELELESGYGTWERMKTEPQGLFVGQCY